MNPSPHEDVVILVIDDERSIRDSLRHWFEEDGFPVETAANATAALELLQRRRVDIVLLDIKLPGMDGMELLKRLRSLSPELVVIMITAFASVETAVRALKDGAYDYVTKPFDPDDLNRLIRRAIGQRVLTEENRRLKAKIDELALVDDIIGESEAMRRVVELIGTVAGAEATVLVLGETGTGKELVARAIHANSPRRYFPILTVNCGAVPDGLLESELFGHERGAFTGATQRRKGKLELAHGGTLFLDEIGNISPRMQMELLAVLETKRFMRLGGSHELEVDFRLVSATNVDLEEAVRGGRFREDLYYRLNVFRIDLPPLRERAGDVALLARHFVRRFAQAMAKPVRGITPDGCRLLERYAWPGNVRELRNVIERALVVCQEEEVGVAQLGFQFPDIRASLPPAPAITDESLAAVERAHIERTLPRYEGNITRAAKALGIDRVTLYSKIKKYGIER